MDIKLQISSELERISYILNVQSSKYLCELITTMWEWMSKHPFDLPLSVRKSLRTCQAGQETLLERE